MPTDTFPDWLSVGLLSVKLKLAEPFAPSWTLNTPLLLVRLLVKLTIVVLSGIR